MVRDEHAVLEEYRGWLRKVAIGLVGANLVEDLAQEGWIAMWRALRSHDPAKGALPAWLTLNAFYRMCDCARDEAWLGRPRRHLGRGKLADATEYATADDVAVWDRLTAADLADDLMWGYHTGQILAAINRLSPQQRRYVYLRFFRGYRYPDLVEAFGYDPQGLWSSPKNGARGKLRAELAELAF